MFFFFGLFPHGGFISLRTVWFMLLLKNKLKFSYPLVLLWVLKFVFQWKMDIRNLGKIFHAISPMEKEISLVIYNLSRHKTLKVKLSPNHS